MNLIRIALIIFLIHVSMDAVYCQGNNELLKLSVSEAQSYALLNNRTVLSSRIDISLAGKKIWENLALGLPQVNVDANYLHQFVVPEISIGPYLDINSLPDGTPVTRQDLDNAFKDSDPIPLGVKNNTTIDFTLSQLVFSGEYFVGLKATRVVKDISEKSLLKTEDETKEAVAGAYYQVLVIQENLRLLKESLRSVEQTYDELVKMNQQGLNEETDVDQMRINISNIQTLINSLESRRDISVKVLKYQLGVGFDREVLLTDSLNGIIQQGALRYLTTPEYKFQNSLDYQLLDSREKVSELLVRLEKVKSLPSVAAFYRHQEQTNQPSFNFAVKDVVGANFKLPVLSSGARSSRVSQAKYDLKKIRLAKENTEQGLTMEFETALSDYRTAYSNFITLSESMALSKKVYERTVVKCREGVSSSLELAQSQTQFLTAESNYYNSLLSLLNAGVKLDRILRTN